MTGIDDVARTVAGMLSISQFELEALVSGRHNNIYLLEEPSGDRHLVKEYLPTGESRFYEDPRRRFRRENLVLRTANSASLPVPDLLAADEDRLVLIEEYCDGETLDQYLQTGGDDASLATTAGIWLGLLHSLFPIRDRRVSLVEYATVFDELQQTVADEDAKSVLRRVGVQLEETAIREWAFCRNDCHPRNFIVRGDELIGLDFEMASFQPANMDVVGMAIAIGKASSWLDPTSDETLRRLDNVLTKVAEGYDLGRNAESDGNHAAYVAIRFLKIANRSEDRAPWIHAAGRVLDQGI